LSSGTQARADWRGLFSAALIGSGIGLGLGASYLTAGLGQAAADHFRSEQVAAATPGVSSEAMLQRGMDAGVPAALAQAGSKDRVSSDRGRELYCLTSAVYFEARGETPRGQAAVAQVVMNRVANPRFPKSVCGVVFQGVATHGCQFSFACDGSMRRGREAGAWDRARRIAERALSGVVLADVGKATHFHTTGVDPEWGPQMLRVAQVGLHVFYRFNPHAPVARPDDDRAVFVNLPMGPASNLQLTTAVLAKTADAAVAATGLASPAAATVPATEAKAAPAKPAEPATTLSKAAATTAPEQSTDTAAY
jgi:spore germination cell wall hydrolase CwlJ-like protein